MHKEVLFFLLLKSILHSAKKGLFNETTIVKKKKDGQVPVNISGVPQCKTSARPSGGC